MNISLRHYIDNQIDWSFKAFGPGERTKGIIDHIRKELKEIEAKPDDVEEWIDVIILALDGAWRAGSSPSQIMEALEYKQIKNQKRQWPDWKTAEPGKAMEHIKEKQ